MQYFTGYTSTISLIKTKYRELAFQFHPDKNPDGLEVMKLINQQYHELLKAFDGTKSFSDNNKEYTYKYNADVEQAIIDKLNELINASLTDCSILLIGNWIWITGDTKQHKDKIKFLK